MSFSLSSSKFFSFMWVHFFVVPSANIFTKDSIFPHTKMRFFTATARNLQCHWNFTDILSCPIFGPEKLFEESAHRSSVKKHFICKTTFLPSNCPIKYMWWTVQKKIKWNKNRKNSIAVNKRFEARPVAKLYCLLLSPGRKKLWPP